jgi:hypothetical protein
MSTLHCVPLPEMEKMLQTDSTRGLRSEMAAELNLK